MHSYTHTYRQKHRHEVWNSNLDIRVCPSLNTPCKQHHHYYQIRWMERVLNRTIESFANNSWLQIQLKNVLWLLCVVSLIPHIMLPFFSSMLLFFQQLSIFTWPCYFQILPKNFAVGSCSVIYVFALFFLCHAFHIGKNIKTVWYIFWFVLVCFFGKKFCGNFFHNCHLKNLPFTVPKKIDTIRSLLFWSNSCVSNWSTEY